MYRSLSLSHSGILSHTISPSLSVCLSDSFSLAPSVSPAASLCLSLSLSADVFAFVYQAPTPPKHPKPACAAGVSGVAGNTKSLYEAPPPACRGLLVRIP